MRLANPHIAGGLAAAVLALSLIACGEDDPEQTTAPAVTGAAEMTDSDKAPGTEAPKDEPADDPASDRADIEITLESILTGSDPEAACDTLVTDRYLRRSYGDAAGCFAAQGGGQAAKSVRLSQAVVSPDSVAQAQARPRGGIYDGQTLRAVLVLDEDTWKLDSLRSNVPVGP